MKAMGRMVMCRDPNASADGEYSVLPVTDSARIEWDSYVTRADAAELYHDYRWRGLIAEQFGHETFYFAAKNADGNVCGVLPMVRLRSRLFGDFLVSMPYVNYAGCIADTAAARAALLDSAAVLADDLGVSHIELRHRDDDELVWPARQDKVTMRLELPGSAEILWKMLKPKLRAQIRRPQKEGASVRSGSIELLDDFYAVFARNMRDLGTPVYPKRFFGAILRSFVPQARLFVVYLSRKPTAAGLVIGHRQTLEIPWASSLREHNRVGVNMLLYWSVLEYAASEGFRIFDFGRSSVGSGTYRFKAQWGAEPQQLRWHYWLSPGVPMPQLTPTNPKYQAAIAAWRRLPLPIANALGPLIVKNLP